MGGHFDCEKLATNRQIKQEGNQGSRVKVIVSTNGGD